MSCADTMATEKWRVQVWRDGLCVHEQLFDSCAAAQAHYSGTASYIDGLHQLQHRKAGSARFVTKDEYPKGGRR